MHLVGYLSSMQVFFIGGCVSVRISVNCSTVQSTLLDLPLLLKSKMVAIRFAPPPPPPATKKKKCLYAKKQQQTNKQTKNYKKCIQLKGWEHNRPMSNFSPFFDVARICPNFCMCTAIRLKTIVQYFFTPLCVSY